VEKNKRTAIQSRNFLTPDVDLAFLHLSACFAPVALFFEAKGNSNSQFNIDSRIIF